MSSITIRSLVLAALVITTAPGYAQFTITGLTDRTTPPYANTVTFTVGTQSGYIYGVFLNKKRVPTDVPITLNDPDYYELYGYATNLATGVVTTRLVRFIIEATERADTEWGVPRHTPAPVIPSAAAEFTGAQLRLIVPEDFPAGFEIPVIAWVVNDQGRAVRANGSLAADGHPSIGVKRGVGSGFLAANNPAGTLNYAPQIKGLQTTKGINLEAVTTWTSVSGPLSGTTAWPDNSRIRVTAHSIVPAGSTLTIGEGTIVLLNPGVNITNNGSVLINGTIDRPVVLMPQSRAQPWGGFFMRTSTGLLNATGTIFTGSGADPNGGAGHRPEQCLFLVDSTPRITLTDCAAIHLAGQFGHAYNGGTFNFTRFLLQRATTGGEYTGASFTVNDSAFIEFPDDSGTFENEDQDGLYFVSGTHAFTNTLFGWTKDDGIDSGGSGYGPLTYQSCWFESIFHEGNSLSGYKNVLSRDTVYMDCGQGIENGYNGPTNRMDHCLFLANQVGLRHGDNYDNIGDYNGRETATNCLVLFNYRDVFGYNWRRTGGWTNAWGQMTILGNWLTAQDTNFPNNSVWSPASDGWRLASFMTTPPNAAVGVGFALRTNLFATTALAQGVPVRLSSFTTNFVTVDYVFRTGGVGPLGAGTLVFAPGETMKRIFPAGFDVAPTTAWNLQLTGAVGGELTGLTNVSFAGSIPVPQVSLAVSTNLLPGYRIVEGIFVRLNGPSAQPVTVHYTNRANGAPVSSGTLLFNPPETVQQFFVTEINPFDYSSVEFTLGAADGGALAGITSVTYTNPALTVSFGVPGNQADLATLSNGLPVSLNGPAPSGVSVQFQIEDSGQVLTNGSLSFAQGEISKLLTAPSIAPAQHNLLRATLRDPVVAQLASPSTIYLVTVAPTPPATNTTLIARGATWKYRDLASDPGATWRNTNYNDGGWSSGPAQLGFSYSDPEGDEATPIADNDQITSYFRRTFNVANPAAFTNLALWLLRDDAGVVHLNGREVFRSPNLPAFPAAIGYSTTSLAPNGENTIDTTTIAATNLWVGINWAAVEIHQQGPTSSDVSFDLELIGIGAPPPAPPQHVYLATFDGQLTIAWGNPAFGLEYSSQVTGPWTNSPAASPFLIVPSGQQQFYRITKP